MSTCIGNNDIPGEMSNDHLYLYRSICKGNNDIPGEMSNTHMYLYRSIGICVHSDIPGEMRLVRGASVTLENFENAEFVDFFTNVSNHVLPCNEKGQVDIFVPLASCGSTIL